MFGSPKNKIKLTVHGVVFQQVDQVVGVHEGVVDGHDLGGVGVASEAGSEHEAADSAEAVDSEFDVGHAVF